MVANFSVYSDIYDMLNGAVLNDFRQNYHIELGANDFAEFDIAIAARKLVALVPPAPSPGNPWQVSRYRLATGVNFDYAYSGPNASFSFDFLQAYDPAQLDWQGRMLSGVSAFPYYLAPEPSGLGLLAAGLLAFGIARRRTHLLFLSRGRHRDRTQAGLCDYSRGAKPNSVGNPSRSGGG